MTDPETMTVCRLRRRLAATRPPADPTNVVMPPGSEQWPPSMRDRLSGVLKPAGVLVPVLERLGASPALLFTERSAALRYHAGQISFPGGRMEPGDADIEATALRETHEEVGIARQQVSVIGYLAPMPTVTGYAVTPVIGVVEAGAELRIDPGEVEAAFEVPLDWLLDPGNRHTGQRRVEGQDIPMIEFHFEGRRIWGATAFIVLQLIEFIKKQ